MPDSSIPDSPDSRFPIPIPQTRSPVNPRVPLYLGIEFIVQSDQYFIVFAKTSAPPWSFRGGSVPVVRYQFWDSDFEEIEGAASKRRRQDGVKGGF